MADVAKGKSLPIDIDITSEGDDFKQLTHFVLVNQLLHGGGFAQVGC